jgi:hypothetical protein
LRVEEQKYQTCAKVLGQVPRSKTGEKRNPLDFSAYKVPNKDHKEVRQLIRLRTTVAGNKTQKKKSEKEMYNILGPLLTTRIKYVLTAVDRVNLGFIKHTNYNERIDEM